MEFKNLSEREKELLEKLPKDCGILAVKPKGEKAHVLIYIDEDNIMLRRILVDNIYDFYTIVNGIFFEAPKIVTFYDDEDINYYEKFEP